MLVSFGDPGAICGCGGAISCCGGRAEYESGGGGPGESGRCNLGAACVPVDGGDTVASGGVGVSGVLGPNHLYAGSVQSGCIYLYNGSVNQLGACVDCPSEPEVADVLGGVAFGSPVGNGAELAPASVSPGLRVGGKGEIVVPAAPASPP